MVPAWSYSLPWQEIRQSANTFGLSQTLIAAICQKESAGNCRAMRYEPGYKWLYEEEYWAKHMGTTVETERELQKFSWGIMQIMGATAREYGFDEQLPVLLNPEDGIHYGVKFLFHKVQKYNGNTVKAIAAYNAGSARYRESGELVNIGYVQDVLKLQRLLE